MAPWNRNKKKFRRLLWPLQNVAPNPFNQFKINEDLRLMSGYILVERNLNPPQQCSPQHPSSQALAVNAKPNLQPHTKVHRINLLSQQHYVIVNSSEDSARK